MTPSRTSGWRLPAALYFYGRWKAEARHIVPAMRGWFARKRGSTAGRALPSEQEPDGSQGLGADSARAFERGYSKRRIQAKLALILLSVSDQERDAMIKSMLESPHLDGALKVADFLVQLGMRRWEFGH